MTNTTDKDDLLERGFRERGYKVYGETESILLAVDSWYKLKTCGVQTGISRDGDVCRVWVKEDKND